jgi:hypothetical protein
MSDQQRDAFAPDEDPSRTAPPPLPAYQPPAPAARPDPADDPELRARALKKLEAAKGFRIHLTVYLAVIGFLTAIWLTTGGSASCCTWPRSGGTRTRPRPRSPSRPAVWLSSRTQDVAASRTDLRRR